MPYISQERRKAIHKNFGDTDESIIVPEIRSVGELNFAITKLCLAYMSTPNYTRINDVMGVLDCVGKEFYRRVAALYEDRKAAENGDVFPRVVPLDNLNIDPATRQMLADALRRLIQSEQDSPENDPFGDDPLPPPQRPTNTEIQEIAAGDVF